MWFWWNYIDQHCTCLCIKHSETWTHWLVHTMQENTQRCRLCISNMSRNYTPRCAGSVSGSLLWPQTSHNLLFLLTTIFPDQPFPLLAVTYHVTSCTHTAHWQKPLRDRPKIQNKRWISINLIFPDLYKAWGQSKMCINLF